MLRTHEPRQVSVIEAVLFDWGGVIQRTVDTSPRQELAAEVGRRPNALEAAVFGHHLWDLASVGGISAARLWTSICRDLGWPAARCPELVSRFFAGDCVDQQIVELIETLRTAGTPVALLSNAPPPFSPAGPAGRWGASELFDDQVFSFELGVPKPDARAFRGALARLGWRAERTLFVDDAADNVAAARELGLAAIHYSGTESLIDSLSALDLPHRA